MLKSVHEGSELVCWGCPLGKCNDISKFLWLESEPAVLGATDCGDIVIKSDIDYWGTQPYFGLPEAKQKAPACNCRVKTIPRPWACQGCGERFHPDALKKCAQCLAAYFCGPRCQRNAWTGSARVTHTKIECKALRQLTETEKQHKALMNSQLAASTLG